MLPIVAALGASMPDEPTGGNWRVEPPATCCAPLSGADVQDETSGRGSGFQRTNDVGSALVAHVFEERLNGEAARFDRRLRQRRARAHGLLSRADSALYRAKRSGKNRVELEGAAEA